MLTIQEFNALLEARKTLVIDGALATELEMRGHSLNHALWSAKVLKEDPDSIKAVHLDYFLAGADIAITSSYQAATQGLRDHFDLDDDDDDEEEEEDDAAKALIRRSVQVAQQAREEAYRAGAGLDRKLLVAGSVGPFGAYLADGSEYRGDYIRAPEEFKNFHRPRIQALIDGGVDLLALETIPSVLEIRALLELLAGEFPTSLAWLSCTIRDAESLCDSTPWKAVVDAVSGCSQIVGLGVNCVSMAIAADALRSLHALTDLPLVCYPNSGEIFNAETKTWHPPQSHYCTTSDNDTILGIAASCHAWTAHGARLIGGCCRTGPAFIQAVDRALSHQRRQHGIPHRTSTTATAQSTI